MRQESQYEKTIFNLVRVDGVGTVCLRRGGYCDVSVVGYFTHGYTTSYNKWTFIIHRDLKDSEAFAVSEASTGRLLKDETYYSVEDALHFVIPFIEARHTQFATSVGNILVKTQVNLLPRNSTNLQTLAIDTALWL